jgi:3'-phosphoadenosine 5'-phosphosulfate sulfotransferase
MRLEEVYDSDRKVARFRFAISIRAQIYRKRRGR